MYLFIRKTYLTIVIIIWVSMFILSPFVFAGDRNTRILIDQAGRSVQMPETPQRVIALAPSVTEIVYALHCQDRLKGVTVYSNYPDAARMLPHIGTYINLDIEKIVSLQPDLCIAVKDGNPKEAVLRLESLGISVYAINPRNLSSIISSVVAIGEVLNNRNGADELAQEMRTRIKQVKERVSSINSRPRVFFQIGVTPIVSAGHDTFIHELIEKSGGVNLAGSYQSYPRFSSEEILTMSPEIIIITTMTKDQSYDDIKAQWQQWPQIPAVKNNRIFVVDSDVFDRPTPRLIDGLELLVRLIHPELYQK
jgi:iron complex transport system substrate-binding protein